MLFRSLAVVVGLLGTVSATVIPRVLSGLDDARVAGAARYMSSRLVEARLDAVRRSRHVAVRFTSSQGVYSFTAYADGNGNGVLASDILAGIDRPIGGPEKLSDNFRRVEFGTQPGLPAIDKGGTAPGSDPIVLGTSNSVSFSALGGATPGTIYLTGPSKAQWAVRITGTTGRVRTYRFDRRSGKWVPM